MKIGIYVSNRYIATSLDMYPQSHAIIEDLDDVISIY